MVGILLSFFLGSTAMACDTVGKPVSAESILPNADGSFSVNKPKILFNGQMVTVASESDIVQLCKYFGFATRGVDWQSLPSRGNKAQVLIDGTVVASSSLYALSRMNCRQ